jgi:1-phosphatidylinositol-4-phosphate 5-kinase
MRDLRFHGQGKLKSKGEDYQGLFRAGTFLHGKLTSHDGTIFSGSFEDACKSGEGELRTADGTVYKGYFRRDKFDGKG